VQACVEMVAGGVGVEGCRVGDSSSQTLIITGEA
jgi:hypothetical protein